MIPGILSGVKVVEFGQNLAGPYCGQILAFLGADVVKVERPEGDDARKWGPPFVDGAATGRPEYDRTGRRRFRCSSSSTRWPTPTRSPTSCSVARALRRW